MVECVDKVCHYHVEKERLRQVETTRMEELWGKAGGEVGGGWRCDYCTKKNTACHWLSVKCGKITEVTPGTLDVKSGPTRYQKGLQLQPMCCAPFRLLSQDFRTRRQSTGDRRIRVKDQSCSWSRTLENNDKPINSVQVKATLFLHF